MNVRENVWIVVRLHASIVSPVTRDTTDRSKGGTRREKN